MCISTLNHKTKTLMYDELHNFISYPFVISLMINSHFFSQDGYIDKIKQSFKSLCNESFIAVNLLLYNFYDHTIIIIISVLTCICQRFYLIQRFLAV